MSGAPSRRTALSFGISTIVGGFAAPLAATCQDADLIRICGDLLRIDVEKAALFSQCHTVEDETRTEPALVTLYDRHDRSIAELERLGPPKTLAGLKAMATASLVVHDHKSIEGDVIADGDGHWMALVILETLVAGVAA